jgi:DNA-binding winged helix-turn-helix (wHTH) protein
MRGVAASDAGSPQGRWKFGDCLFDAPRGSLQRQDREVHLRPKTWELLAYLVQHPSRLIPRDELVAALWPNSVVTDDSLVQCVAELRQALGDYDKGIVRTVARRGYRFDAVLVLAEGTSEAPSVRADAQVQLDDCAPTLSDAWMLLRRLADRAGIAAARRRFEREYQLDGTNADALSGVALSHVIDVLHRWSATPRWQIELAREAADEALSLDHRNALAHHARAHVAMLEGCHFEARTGFRRALDLDPSLAHAHLRLGIIELELGRAERTAEHVRAALGCTTRTLALEAQCAFVAGMAAFHMGRDDDAALCMHRSIELNPGGGFAHQWLAAIDALHGCEECDAHLIAFCRRAPGHTTESLRATERSWHPVFRSQRERFYEGLRLAGLPR